MSKADAREAIGIVRELLYACRELLARVESDIESDRYKVREGDIGRAAIAKATA